MPEKKSTKTGTIGADTTFLIDFFKGLPPAVDFMRNYAKLIRVSELVIYEFLCGNLKNTQQEKFLMAMQSFDSMNFNREAAIIAGSIFRNSKKKGLLIGHQDCMIAGSYLAHGVSKIVTRNKKHFSSFSDVHVIDY